MDEFDPDFPVEITFVLAKPRRRFARVLECFWPRRLTLTTNPAIYAWLWWNIGINNRR